MATKKSEGPKRIKNPNPPAEGPEPVKKRIKAGSKDAPEIAPRPEPEEKKNK